MLEREIEVGMIGQRAAVGEILFIGKVEEPAQRRVHAMVERLEDPAVELSFVDDREVERHAPGIGLAQATLLLGRCHAITWRMVGVNAGRVGKDLAAMMQIADLPSRGREEIGRRRVVRPVAERIATPPNTTFDKPITPSRSSAAEEKPELSTTMRNVLGASFAISSAI